MVLGVSGEVATPDSILYPHTFKLEYIISGASGEVATPDPIPNSAVKHFSTDDIWALCLGKVGRCQELCI